MGHGYAFSVASRVGADFPIKGLSFYNRGISGNKVSALKVRWEKDVLELRPYVFSILVGVNAVDTAIQNDDTAAVQKYEMDVDPFLT